MTPYGLGGAQAFRMQLESSASIQQTADWYVQQWSSRGWTVQQNSTQATGAFLWFERIDPVPFTNPPVPINFEKLWIHLSSKDSGDATRTFAQVDYHGYFWWGWPSQVARFIVVLPFIWMGEGAEVFEQHLRFLYLYW